MEIEQARASDLTDSVGASKVLSGRFGRNFGVDSVHQLVKQNRLRSFLFQDGILVERNNVGVSTRGKDLLFLKADLDTVEVPRRAGRPLKGIEQ